MHQLRHPLNGDLYEALSDDIVRVEHDGRQGQFTRNGRWLSGDLRAPVDPELCRWVSSHVTLRAKGTAYSGRDKQSHFQRYLATHAEQLGDRSATS
jgi:hypothetical protein